MALVQGCLCKNCSGLTAFARARQSTDLLLDLDALLVLLFQLRFAELPLQLLLSMAGVAALSESGELLMQDLHFELLGKLLLAQLVFFKKRA